MSKGKLGLISLSNIMGPINDLYHKLASNHGLLWLKELKILLRKSPKDIVNLPIFKTIIIGTHNNLQALEKDVRYSNKKIVAIQNHSLEVMSELDFSLNTEESTIKLLTATVAELGFNDDKIIYEEICKRIKELGYKLCPAETGPQLRLQYTDQPPEEWLYIATKPMIDSGHMPHIFAVGHESDRHKLDVINIERNISWSLEARFVFMDCE